MPLTAFYVDIICLLGDALVSMNYEQVGEALKFE